MPVDSADLVARARRAAAFSWSPYSRFPVGAALLCADGTVVTGTNVENRSYGLTNCAERSALFAAVSQGRRDFRALAVCCAAAAAARSSLRRLPAGAQRVLPARDARVLRGRDGDEVVETTIGELLPADSLHDLKDAADGIGPPRPSLPGVLLGLLQVVFHLGAPDLRLLLDDLGLLDLSQHDVQPAEGGEEVDAGLDVVDPQGGQLVLLPVAVRGLLQQLPGQAEVGEPRRVAPASGDPCPR